ncbi:hypothetical protein ACWEO2_19200 [Nocardia sp. NPDC004278]
MPTLLPLARTNAEAHLYLELQPCPNCGEPRCKFRSSVVSQDGVLASRYTGECPRCGLERSYEFRLPEEILPPPASTVRFGGDQPSELIDPGIWLWYADDLARRIPTDASGFDAGQRRSAKHTVATAVAAVEEVLKFIPSGADEVPADEFTSPEGQSVRAQEPGRFQRERLEAIRDYYATEFTKW